MTDEPDKDSKTEEATEKKIRDAVEKGQLPFAREVPVVASFLAILVFTIFLAQPGAVKLSTFLSMFIERPEAWSLATEHDAILLYRHIFLEIAKLLAGLMALLILFGLSASIFQNMPRMVLDRVQPKFSRVSLKGGWSRLYGAKGLAEFAKSLGKLTLAGTVLALGLGEAQTRLLSGMITQPEAFGAVIREMAIEILVSITAIMVVIALIDVVWTRFHWRRDLRMTKQEVKDEMKQSEGDPIMRSRLRSLQRDRARQRMMAEVPKATLVIANPTHYAIALRYVRDETAAPVVVAKGQDLIALKIREIAEAHEIPVFEDVSLARSMYDQVSVSSVIPPQFYQAVAELVRLLYANKDSRTGQVAQ
ncbi:flagellar biosynthesis protein FlhB [Aquamicrobium zhengzhouense]|uniref:Flagellar biosynthetic protein FlhB n=1 Tax=Aquamicrobium zhengzhouense TaxID=2781738 RepID=A0ABS0S8Z2_9HYPH|nr:flagellar biosynthesis protein FlhB [Aquamicrobium zhengzhouense]MBI1619759.1 flagellar biosynthesis protein FlhB [Aquamicrobium zhengzhouense]